MKLLLQRKLTTISLSAKKRKILIIVLQIVAVSQMFYKYRQGEFKTLIKFYFLGSQLCAEPSTRHFFLFVLFVFKRQLPH